MPYRTILVGTDGSDTAAIAEGVAFQFAAAAEGRVLVVSAFRDEDEKERSGEAAEAARARAEAAGVAADVRLIEADPPAGIVELADRMDADLIVARTSGGDVGMGARHALRLGAFPTASRTTCRATC